jgi:hypothetical protein
MFPFLSVISIVPSNGEYQKHLPKSKSTTVLAMTVLVRYNKGGGNLVKERQHPRSWHRRFVIAAVVLCISVLALLAAVIVIAPKVINSAAVRSRIEATIAKELHGTVTYERVELALLPRPDVVLHEFAVQVPGTLSATIDAVRVYARLLPLFRGQFAVSSVVLEQPELSLTLTDNTVGRRSSRPPATQPAGASFDTALAIAGRELPDLSIKITKGKIGLMRDGRSFLSLRDLDASFAFVQAGQEAPAAETSTGEYHVTGMARATVIVTTALPAPLKVSIEQFDAMPGSLMVKKARARLQDLDASISCSFNNYLTRSFRSDIKASGTIGPDTLAWLQKLMGVPEGMSIRAPLLVTEARLRSTGTGSDASRMLTIKTGKKGDTTISLVLRQEPGLFSIDTLRLKDNDSDGEITFSRGPGGIDLSFAGNLTGATIDRVLERSNFSSTWIKGDLKAHVQQGKWSEAAIHGSIEGGQLSIPLSREIPVTLERFTVLADGTTVDLGPVVLSLGPDVLQMEGSASLAKDSIRLDLDVTTDRINLSTLRSLTERKTPEHHDGNEAGPGSRPSLSGSVRLRAATFVLNTYQAETVNMQLTFGKAWTTAVLDHALVCGITVTGTLQTVGNEVEISLNSQASGKKLEECLPCIFHKDLGVSGSYNLSGQIDSSGSWDTLVPSMGGSFALNASGGRIQSDSVVKGIIAYLNSTSLLKGSHDTLLKEGLPYEAIVFRGTLRDGTLSLSEGVIRGRDLNIATEGKIGLRDGTLALNVLAAPFTHLDRLLGNVPIVKNLVGNSLIAIPVRVEGTFGRPDVRPLPASAVGRNVTNLMNNALKAPMKIIDPVIPKELVRKNEASQE